MNQSASKPEISGSFQVTGGYELFRRAWVQVIADSSLAGKMLEIRDDEKCLGEAPLREDLKQCIARFELPIPPPGHSFRRLSLWMDGQRVADVDLPDAAMERLKALESVEVHFAPYVFDGPEFPPCDFEQPSLVEDLIGRYTVHTTFFNRDYQAVTTAERPGRYGAVVEITANGRVFRRFRTLYRKPDRARPPWHSGPARPRLRMSQPMPEWYGRKGPFPLELPQDLGIDPDVIQEQGTTIFEYLRGRWEYAIWDDPWTPILLAGLHETILGARDLRRNNAWERDRRWWVGLKQRTGDLKTPHLSYLPEGYDQDPAKRWPLVLFLHGSGEIGDNLDLVRQSGLPKLAEEGRSFPFILIAPQSPEEEWFWLAAAQNVLLDQVCANYRVDPDRIYVTGLSMGGRGTWMQAIEYPDRFAAIAPICGSIPDLEEANRIKHMPVWAFVGADDDDQSIRQMVEALQALGGDARLTVYPETGHDAWTPTYADPTFFEWILSHRRTR
jgi:predicted esterase